MNKLIFFTLSGLLLTGCASTTPNLDDQHGASVRKLTAKQIINPAASSNTDQVKGMDGKAAADALGRYNDSFKTPPPPINVFTFGGAGGGK